MQTAANEWVHAAGQLQDSLSEWMSLHRGRHIRLVLPFSLLRLRVSRQFDEGQVQVIDGPVNRPIGMHDFAGELELATSVFHHPGTNTIMIGRDACRAWKLTGKFGYGLRPSPKTCNLI